MVAEMPGKLGTLASEEEDEPVDGSVYLGNWGMFPLFIFRSVVGVVVLFLLLVLWMFCFIICTIK